MLRCRALLLLLLACSGPGGRRVEIAGSADDGSLHALAGFLPVPCGWAAAGDEDCRVGTSLTGSGETLRCRILYRFDIADWQRGDITLHLRCAASLGSPGAVEVLCIDTFPALPDTMPLVPGNISAWWDLAADGSAVGSVSPVPNSGFALTVPESVVSARSGGGWLCFMLKLADETRPAESWFRLATYDYAVIHGTDMPYLTWKE